MAGSRGEDRAVIGKLRSFLHAKKVCLRRPVIFKIICCGGPSLDTMSQSIQVGYLTRVSQDAEILASLKAIKERVIRRFNRSQKTVYKLAQVGGLGKIFPCQLRKG